jgi:hypothetical protein
VNHLGWIVDCFDCSRFTLKESEVVVEDTSTLLLSVAFVLLCFCTKCCSVSQHLQSAAKWMPNSEETQASFVKV